MLAEALVPFDVLFANLRAVERRGRAHSRFVRKQVRAALNDSERARFDAAGEQGDVAALANLVGEIKEQRLSALLEEAARTPAEELRERYPLYVRFGDAPAGGISLDHKTMQPEPGLSAFRAYSPKEGVYVLHATSPSLADAYKKFVYDAGRPVFLAEGTEVGVGGGHEPCLTPDASLRLLPEGTRLGCVDSWQPYATLHYAHSALVQEASGVPTTSPAWYWEPSPSARVDHRGRTRLAEELGER